MLHSGCAPKPWRPDIHPRDESEPVERYFKSAEIAFSQGLNAETIEQLESAASYMEPGDARRLRYHERRGAALFRAGHFTAAKQAYTQALQFAKKHRLHGREIADAYAGLGLCLMEESRFPLAIRYLERGLASGPSATERKRIRKNLERGEAWQSSDTARRVRRIKITGNRTREETLLMQLPFEPGDKLEENSLEEARKALFGMSLFKSVEVSSASAADGGVEVDISLHDGWYVIPFPFYFAGSGGGRGGLFLTARNIFRRAESFSAMGMGSRKGARWALGMEREGWSWDADFQRNSFTERLYDDQGLSSVPDLGEPPDSSNPSRYGSVAASSLKRVEEGSLTLTAPLPLGMHARISGIAGWDYGLLRYAGLSGPTPADSGRQSKAFLGLSWGSRANPSGSDLGAILGFGLADLESRIKPLSRILWQSSGNLKFFRADRWTGSDFRYGYGTARIDSSIRWGRHQSLFARLGAGRGTSLPLHRLLATGGQTGLQGNYAREFRGGTAAGLSLGYSHPFRMTRRGVWQGILFAENARVWSKGKVKDKSGVGASFWYRFWRFPIPLGASYTYSLDDRDTQISAALGGSF